MKPELPGSIFLNLGRLIRKSFTSEFRATFGDEISPVEGKTLGYIRSCPGVSPKEVGRYFEWNKSSTSELVGSLVAKGFVEERVNPNDKRGKHLYITPKGEEMDQRAKEALLRHDERLFADISEEEYKTVEEIYRKIEMKTKGEPHEP